MPEVSPAPTIAELFRANVERRPDELALGAIVDGQLRWRCWQELARDVEHWAAALRRRGVQLGAPVVQLAANSYAWVVVDLALHWLGAVHVPLHAALTVDQAIGQIDHSQAGLAVVDNRLAAAEEICRRLGPAAVATHDELARLVAERGSQDRLSPVEVRGEDLASILYTSGTTGEPLGVTLTHQNLASNAVALAEALPVPPGETRLAILPLSHIYGRTCDLYCWLVRGSRLVLAESRETILRDCQLVRPTSLNGVPYFYRKVAHALVERRSGGDPDALRQILGGAVRRLFCGGGALAPEIEAFYQEHDLPICCGYGLTEAAPVVTASSPANYRPGTVGPPLANTEVCLAADGEILARGPGITPGYWRNEAATQALFCDGWLQTGDLGVWEGDHLRIVGRKKEMIVLATGKNVPPAAVEGRLAGSPLIEQVCVVGDERDYLTALIVPNPTLLRREIRARRLWIWSRRRALTHSTVRGLYRAEIDRLLGGAAACAQIADFTLLSRGFSVEAGELTPKLSLRRLTIQKHFAREIERMYQAKTARRRPTVA